MGAQRLAAGPLEAQRGRVHEDQAELAEQVAPALEQRLLDQILHAARRQIAVAGGLDILPQPSHRPIEAAKRQTLGAGDGVVRHPVCAGPVRARDHEAVQHRDEHRPLHVEAEAPPGNKLGHHRPAAALLPQPSEQQRRADAAHLEARIPLLDGAQHQGALGETTDGGDQPDQRAGSEHGFLASEITDDALLGAPILAHALYQIEVGVAVDGLLADEHGISIADSRRASTRISTTASKFSTTLFSR